jgi:hypothetical protein
MTVCAVRKSLISADHRKPGRSEQEKSQDEIGLKR